MNKVFSDTCFDNLSFDEDDNFINEVNEFSKIKKVSKKRGTKLKPSTIPYIPKAEIPLYQVISGGIIQYLLSDYMKVITSIDLNQITYEELSFVFTTLEDSILLDLNEKVRVPCLRTQIWTIDGIPGSGKTTLNEAFLKVLSSISYTKYQAILVPEPVANKYFEGLLRRAYTTDSAKERHDTIYKVQRFVVMSFVLRMIKAWGIIYKEYQERRFTSAVHHKIPIILCDVSYESEKMYRFTNYKMKNLTKRQLSSVQILYNRGLKVLRYFNLEKQTQRFYLTTPLETCKKNVDKRDLRGEKDGGLEKSYLEVLQNYFKKHMGRTLSFNEAYSVSVLHLPYPTTGEWNTTAAWICSSVLQTKRSQPVVDGKKMNERNQKN